MLLRNDRDKGRYLGHFLSIVWHFQQVYCILKHANKTAEWQVETQRIYTQ